MPGSSSFARSAVNYQSGAATQLSSMLSSVVVLAVLLFVTPGLQLHPDRGARGAPDPRRLEDDQLAPDPHLLPVHALRRDGVCVTLISACS